MTDAFPTPSRRQFLGAAAGTAATVATAGCLDSVIGTSTAATEIEPEEPSQPREGTPGEFYYFLESNGIEVDELLEEDDELYLTYRSEAETVEESDEEIWLIYEVYKQALIHRGSEIEFIYTELSNPFDGQALGWGINSEWIHEFDSDETAAEGNESDMDNSTTPDGNETAGNESTGDGIDMNQMTLWNNIMNTKVYEDDLEADGDDEGGTETDQDQEPDRDDTDETGDDDGGQENDSDDAAEDQTADDTESEDGDAETDD
ncbi:twin-arginine translocation signal domain-containing protein [Natronorubrum texcoconense]|uniref:Tat (Twin-arginine translocation) pathway signal sequence n=1 Tax=Natronorubrum texcoconense TaxID=1095776 RepID=A0A1G9F924_9EURY|nr:twin-arginine translocation signal domain-containing protein [Natronorubrum texcoconense]SDK84845.1 Tat (twin-arginine translocation) pathway signal sequence [Natronorubrum texcoconense]